MREYIYKAMRIDTGEWIYGSLVHQTDFYGEKVDRYFIIDGTSTQDYGIGYEYEVIPETVGQWTGLTDKYGIKIFEGDIIIVINLHDNHDRYWKQPCGPAIPTLVIWDDENLSYDVPRDSYNFKVIGNIHDNPELLEKENDNG